MDAHENRTHSKNGLLKSKNKSKRARGKNKVASRLFVLFAFVLSTLIMTVGSVAADKCGDETRGREPLLTVTETSYMQTSIARATKTSTVSAQGADTRREELDATEINFTDEEREYIKNAGVIYAFGVEGIAPISYRGLKGEIRGIAKDLVELLAEKTGLVIEFNIYRTGEEVLGDYQNLGVGISKRHASPGMMLSKPFLTSETILYMNSSIDSAHLEGKRYAGTPSEALPEGVKEEDVILYDTREASLNAVETGKADYGCGNAFSVAFYTVQNGYNNIITVPIKQETHDYCTGVLHDDTILLSIVNKAIDSIDDRQMQALILGVTSRIERKVTFSMVMETYGIPIAIFAALTIVLLTVGIVLTIRANKKLVLQREELIERAQTDGLTELYNAQTFKKLVRRRLAMKPADETDAMIMIDLDRFKKVNDTFGHLEGDKLLKHVADAIRTTFRKSDIIGRIGGDEFSIYLMDINNTELIKEKGQRLLNSLRNIDGEYTITVGIGIATHRDGMMTYSDFLNRADKAMYEAKSRGKGEIVIYGEDMQKNIGEQG